MSSLAGLLQQSPYISYPYSYPHKTAYRPLDPPRSLRDLWAEERRDVLFLYMHIPFCEMRCGYCNLFTLAQPSEALQRAYVDTLRRQAERVRAATGPASFARFAIGGGTPTYLNLENLGALFDIAEYVLDVDLATTPISVETSPRTAEADKLHLLRARGVDRISIGVQSFVDAEVLAAGRIQKRDAVLAALARIREVGFPTLNIDLIYGLPGQTVESWLRSLETALSSKPEELYLYPLYVRPLTRMEAQPQTWEDTRLACYRAGRDYLRSAGYRQLSMRLFRAPETVDVSPGGGQGDRSSRFTIAHKSGRSTKIPLPQPLSPLCRGRGENVASMAPSRELGGGWGRAQARISRALAWKLALREQMANSKSSRGGDRPIYRCQEDGMVGLGCGARSYTWACHYSSEYAVSRGGVRAILDDYVGRPTETFDFAHHGFVLDLEEQCRRYILKSLLRREGLALDRYRALFGVDALDSVPEMAELIPQELAVLTEDGKRLQLTEAGLERTDALGPWLYSARVRDLIASHTLR